MIDRVHGTAAAAGQPREQQYSAQGAGIQPSFGQLIQQVQGEAARPQPAPKPQETEPLEQSVQSVINFSKHAMSRAQERGIELTPDLMEKLSGSVEKAQEKGAKNILAFNATQAFIINVPFGRVITTMNQDEMKENFFTNIDGAVLI